MSGLPSGRRLLRCGAPGAVQLTFDMIGLALKMLFGDTAKYLMLVAGLFFATFHVGQQLDVFIEAPERPSP